MTSFDPEAVARVWQRVQAGNQPLPPPIPEDRSLPELIRLSQDLAEEYRRLSLRYTNPERNRLLQMSRQEQNNAAFLRRLMLQPGNNRGRR